jgi:hypothetical protein
MKHTPYSLTASMTFLFFACSEKKTDVPIENSQEFMVE